MKRFVIAALLVATGCSGANRDRNTTRTQESTAPVSAPEPTPAALPICQSLGEDIPESEPADLLVQTWLSAQAATADLDEPILEHDEIEAHNAWLRESRTEGLPLGRASLLEPLTRSQLTTTLHERLAFVRQKIESGTYRDAHGVTLTWAAENNIEDDVANRVRDEIRVATMTSSIRCAPMTMPLYTNSGDASAFVVDPNLDRNACGHVRALDLVRVLIDGPGELLLVRTRTALGWVQREHLSSPLSSTQARTWLNANREVLREATSLRSAHRTLALAAGATVKRNGNTLLFATSDGVFETRVRGNALSTTPIFSRRAFLTQLFASQNTPYGWGETCIPREHSESDESACEFGADCSSLVMESLEHFGLELPRHSSAQALAGTHSINTEALSSADKQVWLDRLSPLGVVLLQLDGHIMIYVGRDRIGRPKVFHEFLEYRLMCQENGQPVEQRRRVARATVTTLALGAGSSIGSLLERTKRIALIGATAEAIDGLEARARLNGEHGAADAAMVDTCHDNAALRIWTSPARARVGVPMRVIVTSIRPFNFRQIHVHDPSGNVAEPHIQSPHGPPYATILTIAEPAAGTYRVIVGEREYLAVCDRVSVSARAELRPPTVDPTLQTTFPNVWEPRIRWEADAEILFGAFVSTLANFSNPDQTFTSLHELLRDPQRNLLHNHLGLDEDAPSSNLELHPDCADLPYYLRAYFAWKLSLPFAFRRCNRGHLGSPPTCSEFITPEQPHTLSDRVAAFRWFIENFVRPGVHSAIGRTSPSDSETDLYPIPLERRWLIPGTVFADPYGHMLVIGGYRERDTQYPVGRLVGIDAQPDGTIAQRTFYEGTFLFTPSTHDVGAGFKAWRPLRFDVHTHSYSEPDNRTLMLDRARGNELFTELDSGWHVRNFAPYSAEQYQGTRADFYARVHRMTNPGGTDISAYAMFLVRALRESAERRAVSIQNAEVYFSSHPGAMIAMPEGLDIFLTEGAWEDYSTPSRDLRLLIALDTVVSLAERVRNNPASFGIANSEAEHTAALLGAQITQAMHDTTFNYVRTDGHSQSVSLEQLYQRRTQIEIGWNPNDCPEVRWGAHDDSELASCQRHASATQRTRMASMRPWFHNRERPVHDH